MAYIGKRPTDSFRSLAVKDTFTGDGSTVAFDISQECGSANDLMVFVDNVRQEPGSGKSYTLGVDGSSLLKRITFDAAPAASAEPAARTAPTPAACPGTAGASSASSTRAEAPRPQFRGGCAHGRCRAPSCQQDAHRWPRCPC